MTSILAIDPGPTESGYVVFDSEARELADFGKRSNDWLLDQLRQGWALADVIVIEQVQSFGMAVGAEVFETVYWSGRFAEAAHPLPVERLGRKDIKLRLCGTYRAKDPNIRQALIDRFGGPVAVGRKASPGPLYGISGDVWSALAVACAWVDGAAA